METNQQTAHTPRTLLQQGGPAYPVDHMQAHVIAMAEFEGSPPDREYIEALAKLLTGPTLRDAFAMAAMQGILARVPVHDPDQAARDFYTMADAMLKARAA